MQTFTNRRSRPKNPHKILKLPGRTLSLPFIHSQVSPTEENHSKSSTKNPSKNSHTPLSSSNHNLKPLPQLFLTYTDHHTLFNPTIQKTLYYQQTTWSIACHLYHPLTSTPLARSSTSLIRRASQIITNPSTFSHRLSIWSTCTELPAPPTCPELHHRQHWTYITVIPRLNESHTTLQ